MELGLLDRVALDGTDPAAAEGGPPELGGGGVDGGANLDFFFAFSDLVSIPEESMKQLRYFG